jgi:hypothetical protein
MFSLNTDKLSLGVLAHKSNLIYTGLATSTVVVLLLIALNRKPSVKATAAKNTRPKSGKMPPPAGSIKVAKLLIHPIKVGYVCL